MLHFHKSLARIGSYQTYTEHDTSELVLMQVAGVGTQVAISALVAASRTPANKLKLVCMATSFQYKVDATGPKSRLSGREVP